MGRKTVVTPAHTKILRENHNVPVFFNYIDGQWVSAASKQTYTVVDPANRNHVLGRFQKSAKEDVQQAIVKANEAFQSWRQLQPPQRADVIFKAWQLFSERKEDVAKVITREEGKPIKDALGEVKRSMNVLEFTAGEGRRQYGMTAPSELKNNLAYTVRKPLGVVAVITPWNFPLAIAIWKIAPALVCGNTVVFKPASSTPMTAIEIARLFEDAGLPRGVLNMVTGPGGEVGDELIKHPLVRAISFTGSTEIGQRIYVEASNRMKKVQCEMGGKNAVVVLHDADIELAVEGIVQGAFGSTGQRCTATSRAVVEEKVYDVFMDKLIVRTKKLKVGNGMRDDVEVGPLASEPQFKKVLSYVAMGREEGATLKLGGRPLTGPDFDDGYYIEPTIFTDVKPEMTIAQEEIFGPVLAVMRAQDYRQAVEMANSVNFGLSASIYTSDISRAFNFVDDIEAGMIHINSPTLGGEAQLPFGGVKASGIGTREQGTAAIDFFSELITVYVDYTGKKREVKFI